VNHATLIVPDVHEQIPKLKRILKDYEGVERVVFLGDFCDSFLDNMVTPTGIWLRENVEHPKYDFIMGNHELHYAYPYGDIPSPYAGWTAQKNFMYRSYVRPDQWERFKLHRWVGNWLCTHAGWHASHMHPIKGFQRESLEAIEKHAMNGLTRLKDGQQAPMLLQPGRYMHGPANYGGVVWLRWAEFEPVPGLNQVCGHSPWVDVRIKVGIDSINYCIDTDLKHVALIEDNKLRIEDV
jgi:hypothetical protein